MTLKGQCHAPNMLCAHYCEMTGDTDSVTMKLPPALHGRWMAGRSVAGRWHCGRAALHAPGGGGGAMSVFQFCLQLYRKLIITSVNNKLALELLAVKVSVGVNNGSTCDLYYQPTEFLPCDAVCTVSVIVILSVRPSVCLSHSWTVSTWFDLRS